MDILSIILVVILTILFPLGEVLRIQFSNGAAVNPLDIGVGVFSGIWLIQKIIKKEKILIRSDKPILIFIGACLLSLLVNFSSLRFEEFIISFLYLFRWTIYTLLFFAIRNFSKESKRKILIAMFSGGLIIVLLGFLQYFLYPDLRNLYYLGWDEHLYRLFSSFLDPNFAAIFLVLLFLLSGGLFFYSIQNKKNTLSLLIAFFSLFILIEIFLTYSRAGFISLFLGVFVLLSLINKKRAIFILLVLIVAFAVFASGITSLKSEGTNFLRTASISARLKSSENALKIFTKNPILGIGFNSYRYAQYRYGFITKKTLINNHAAAGTDNSFLFVLATTGIIGLASYLYLWIGLLKNPIKLIKNNKSKEKILAIVLISSVAAVFINSIFINSLFYPFVMLWMWILLGVTENKKP